MKKIAWLLVFLILMQGSVFAWPNSSEMATAGMIVITLFTAEYFLMAWGVDAYINNHGGGSNYWGSFWGTFLMPIVCYPVMHSLTNANNGVFSWDSAVVFLGAQVGGGYLGNKYLFGGPTKESLPEGETTGATYLGCTRLVLNKK